MIVKTGIVSLSELQVGQIAEIVNVVGNESFAGRLREIGFLPGEFVRMLAAAPLGDPLACLILGSRIAVRRADAACVEVQIR